MACVVSESLLKRLQLSGRYLLVLVLAVLVFLVYHRVKARSFISLRSSAGDCTPVNASLTTSYLISAASSTGSYAWATDPQHFAPAGTSFQVDLRSFTGSVRRLNELVAAAGDSFAGLGRRGAGRDLAWNVLAWSTFGFISSSDDEGLFTLRPLVQPRVVFDQALLLGALGSSAGHCKADNSLVFAPETASFLFTVRGVSRNGTCGAIINPEHFEAIPSSDAARAGTGAVGTGSGSVDVSMRFDARSLVAAAAVNAGLLGRDELVRIPNAGLVFPTRELRASQEDAARRLLRQETRSSNRRRFGRMLGNDSEVGNLAARQHLNGRRLTGSDNATDGSFGAYYLPRWVGMDPVYCFSYAAGGLSCLLQVRSALMFPLLNSFGTGNFETVVASLEVQQTPDFSSLYCNCSVPMPQEDRSNCGALALVSSLVYFPEDPTEGADMFGATLRFAHAAARRLAEVDGDIATAAAAHGPALSTLYSESGFDFDPHWPDIMRPLCVNCTLISLLSSGESAVLNDAGMALASPYCGRNFFEEGFRALAEASPAALSQLTFDCSLSSTDSMLVAGPVALALTALLSLLAQWCLLGVLACCRRVGCKGSDRPSEAPECTPKAGAVTSLAPPVDNESNYGDDGSRTELARSWQPPPELSALLTLLCEEQEPPVAPRRRISSCSEVALLASDALSRCINVALQLSLLARGSDSDPSLSIGPLGAGLSAPPTDRTGAGNRSMVLTTSSSFASSLSSSSKSCPGGMARAPSASSSDDGTEEDEEDEDHCHQMSRSSTHANICVDISREIFDIDADESSVCCHTFVTSRPGPGPFSVSPVRNREEDSPCNSFVTSSAGPPDCDASFRGAAAAPVATRDDNDFPAPSGAHFDAVVRALTELCGQQRSCWEAVLLLNSEALVGQVVSDGVSDSELAALSMADADCKLAGASSGSHWPRYDPSAASVPELPFKTDNTDCLCDPGRQLDDDCYFDV